MLADTFSNPLMKPFVGLTVGWNRMICSFSNWLFEVAAKPAVFSAVAS